MVSLMPELNALKVKHYGDKDAIAEETQRLYKKVGYHPLVSTVPMIIQIVLLMGVIDAVKKLLEGTESMLSVYPAQTGGIALLMPVAAGAAALILGLSQNRLNPLQREQGRGEQLMTNGISIAISLFLGAFVSVGTGLYWICGNLFSILNQLALNAVMPAAKYVDYPTLRESQAKVKEIEDLTPKVSREDKQREKTDYKRFFSVVNKHLVFYSESSGFYKYYRGIINYLLQNTNLTIHYITSDPQDAIFRLSEENQKLKVYYIGEKRLITLMMKLETDIMVMTMPDLENYHIKRSYIRKDIEYLYIPHGMDSLNMTMRTGSIDHYDTVFCVGKHQKEEVRRTEEMYGLPKKNLVEWGYSLLDEMREEYAASPKSDNAHKKILIAPSWQEGNIVDACLEQILDALKKKDYQITVRPHPQHVRHRQEYMEQLKKKYAQDPNIEIQTDFSSDATVFEADLLISDWSGIAYEYAYTTQKPVLFINTPMKVMNPEYEKIGVEPINITLRDAIGCSMDLDDISQVGEKVEMLLKHASECYEKIGRFVEEYVYHLGESGRVGGQYIVGSLQKRIAERKKEQATR